MAFETSMSFSAGQLSLGNVRSALLTRQHIPLLLASCLPAVFLSMILRTNWLSEMTRGATRNPLFTPLYFLAVALGFWIGALAVRSVNSNTTMALSMQGWLLPIQDMASINGKILPWNYWVLFDFAKVEWTALGAAAQNIVLTVFVGIMNLPIYIPAVAQGLDVAQYRMNFELFGHGIANFLAGALGTIPNLLVRDRDLN